MTTVVKLLMEVGIPIGSAIVMGFFIFLTLKYILDGVAGSVQGLTNIMQGLESRVRQMNNDMIKIDLIVSEDLELRPDVDRVVVQKILWKTVKLMRDEIMNIDQIVLIINELGYPILMTLGMGYFIWYVWQYVTKKLKPTISASHKMLINLLTK